MIKQMQIYFLETVFKINEFALLHAFTLIEDTCRFFLKRTKEYEAFMYQCVARRLLREKVVLKLTETPFD